MWGVSVNVKKNENTAVGKLKKRPAFKDNLTEYLCRGYTHLLEWLNSLDLMLTYTAQPTSRPICESNLPARWGAKIGNCFY